MKKNIKGFTLALVFLISPFLYSAEKGKTLSPDVVKTNFNADISNVNLDFLNQTITPEVLKSKAQADFSQIPDFAFSYLNNLVVNAINASVSSFDGVMYSIDMKDVPDALIAARDRGVKVRLIIDENHVYPRMDTQIKRLINAGPGIEVRTLKGYQDYGRTHNKITIHDGELVTVGSYNWTFSATFSNYENILVARNPMYVEPYKKYFEWMWSNSRTIAQGQSPQSVQVGAYGLPPQDNNPPMSLNGVSVPAYLFSPGSDTENRIAALIDACKVSVDAVTFSFSSKPIADALVRAYQRGIKVRFLEDSSMAKSSSFAQYVYKSGVPFKIMGGRNDKGVMHNKFIIYDGKLLSTGSFNFATNASVNSFENVIFVSDTNAIKAYQDKFDWFYSQATVPSDSDFNPDNPVPSDN
jgi:phosphatidylserine/phosphatidylglycerophosphate/cardiolipin synthase-like enzyme